MEFPSDLRYSNDHEWVRDAGGVVTVGITAFAVDQLGDVVYVSLPRVGDVLVAGTRFGTVESVKSVSELIAPVSGTVTKVNAALDAQPELVNQGPYAEGWMVEVAPDAAGRAIPLHDAAAYRQFVGA